MKNILISVVMPTYNSEKTIALALQSIKDQAFPQDQIEILVIDGGSTDATRQIAKKFECKILDNLKVQPEFAKHIGITQAKGKYCVFLDSDEQLLNKKSFQIKFDLLESNLGVKNVLIGGLKNPKGYPFINEYASRFGDPFSYFMYGVDAGDFIESLKHRFKSKIETKEYIIYNVKNEITPICDGGGHFFDLDYLKTIIDISKQKIVSVIFDSMVNRTKKFAIVRNDYIEHYSNTGLSSYLHKVDWRIINNIQNSNDGIVGFSERQKILLNKFNKKKYIYIFYTLTLIALMLDTLFIIVKKKNLNFYMHFFLNLYTICMIIFYYLLHSLKFKNKLMPLGK